MIFIIMCVLFSLSLFKELSFLIFPILFFFPLILIILAFDIYFDFLQLRRVEKAHQCLREIEKLKNYENISIEEINKELNQYFLFFNFKKIKKDQVPFQYLISCLVKKLGAFSTKKYFLNSKIVFILSLHSSL